MFNKRNQRITVRRSRRDTDGHVYFIYSPASGLVKIGFTADVYKRFRDLKTENASPLELLYATPRIRQPYRLEIELHLRFQQYKVHHEWFRLDDKILQEIKHLKSITEWDTFQETADIFKSR